MKYKYKWGLSLLIFCLSLLSVQAQDTIRFNKSAIIGQENSLEAYGGDVIVLGPGVLLVVDGTLCLEGEKNKSVKIINADAENPAVGIQIQGQTADADIKIRHVEFEGMIQALRFDPFWQRDEVILSDLTISGSKSGEPVIYLGDPYIDRRKGSRIDLKLEKVDFYNNRAGIVIEAYGTPNVDYVVDDLLFRDNYFDGPEQAIIHLEIFPEAEAVEGIGNLMFDRNRFEYEPLYLSLSSTFDQEVNIRSIATEADFIPLLDQRKDPRLGRINVAKTRDLKQSEKTDYHVINHLPGVLTLELKNIGRKNLMFDLLSKDEQGLAFDFRPSGDSIIFNYSGGPAKFLQLADGYRVVLPKVDSSLVPGEAELYVEESLENAEDSSEVEELSSLEKVADKTHNFFTKNTQPIKRWEVGLWGGGAVYGAGDIKPKFSFIDDLLYFPSTVDLSMGLYAQYNFNSRFSARASYYNSTISMHDFSAAGFFSGTAPLIGFNDEYQEVELASTAYPASFITQMNILELEGIWHLRPYRVKDHRNSTLVPSLGVSLGMLHYNPYRTPYLQREEGEGYFSYLSRAKPDRVNLRDLGSEGQNFLPGSEPYSTIAYSAGMSFSMTWLFRNFALKGEVRGTYTSTDYLDDYGPGLWYGGDLDAVLDNHQVDNAGDVNLPSVLGNLDIPSDNSFRSTDGLNDWYFQGHFGLSIFLDSFGKK